MESELSKHRKKSKKEKKSKKKKSNKSKKHYSSSSEESSEDEYQSRRKHKKHKKKYSSSSSDSESESDEWVEKKKTVKEPEHERDSWMTNSDLLFRTTGSHSDAKKERLELEKQQKQKDQYNPSTSVRELNPYWKDGGDGLPSAQIRNMFKKPEDQEIPERKKSGYSSTKAAGDWRKKPSHDNSNNPHSFKSSYEDTKTSQPESNSEVDLSDLEINELAAKVIKAEILGNTELHAKLKSQLDAARTNRQNNPKKDDNVMLTITDAKGQSHPLQKRNPYDNGPSTSRDKKKKVETHSKGERVRYFGDDDRYSLNEMFEQEKLRTGNDIDAEFMAISSKLRNKKDDLDDIFTEEIQKQSKHSDRKIDDMQRNKAIKEHQLFESCNMCVDSSKHNKDLVVSVGQHMYLSLPGYSSLTPGHCILSPIRHISCTTQLDEDFLSELKQFRKAICRMFKNELTIFFERAVNLHKHPHMVIECVPIPDEEGAMAPMYFKKAILECEREWSNNKKLVELKHGNVGRSIPKGLPYFAVEFGDNESVGYAHVIEDKRYFPTNFAQEIIGGMLDLDHKLWRRPKREERNAIEVKVKNFKEKWKKYDFNT